MPTLRKIANGNVNGAMLHDCRNATVGLHIFTDTGHQFHN